MQHVDFDRNLLNNTNMSQYHHRDMIYWITNPSIFYSTRHFTHQSPFRLGLHFKIFLVRLLLFLYNLIISFLFSSQTWPWNLFFFRRHFYHFQQQQKRRRKRFDCITDRPTYKTYDNYSTPGYTDHFKSRGALCGWLLGCLVGW